MRSRVDVSMLCREIRWRRSAAAVLFLAFPVSAFCQLRPATYGAGGANTIGTFRPGTLTSWYLDTDGTHTWSGGDTVAWFGLNGDRPIMGDWGNGIFQMGIFRGSTGYWVVDSNIRRVRLRRPDIRVRRA